MKKKSYLIRRLKIYTNLENVLDTLKRNGTGFNIIFQTVFAVQTTF